MNGLRMAAEVMRAESVNKIKDETSNFVKESCEYVISIIKKEMLVLLEQMGDYKKELEQKDLTLGLMCNKFKAQEQKICNLGVKFASHHIETGYTKEEIAHYNQ